MQATTPLGPERDARGSDDRGNKPLPWNRAEVSFAWDWCGVIPSRTARFLYCGNLDTSQQTLSLDEATDIPLFKVEGNGRAPYVLPWEPRRVLLSAC